MCESITRNECVKCGYNYITIVKKDITAQKKYYDANRENINIKQRAYDVANKEKKRDYYKIKKMEKAEIAYQLERHSADLII